MFSCEVKLLSICGPVREENQDAGLAWRGDRGEVVLVISDGMGGHAAGRQAAEIVSRACVQAIRNRASRTWEDVITAGIEEAHASVLDFAGREVGQAAMGATVAIALLEASESIPKLRVAHVGDSRVYLYRNPHLYRLTADHSLVAEMVRDGLLSESEAFGHPESNVILRAVGQKGSLMPEIHEAITLLDGDIVLVCSDGLHGVVRDQELSEVIANSRGVGEISENLLAAALEAGSKDNITIGCARVGSSRVRNSTRVSGPDSREDRK